MSKQSKKEMLIKIENEMNKNKIDIHQIEDMLLLAKEDVSQVKEEAEEKEKNDFFERQLRELQK